MGATHADLQDRLWLNSSVKMPEEDIFLKSLQESIPTTDAVGTMSPSAGPASFVMPDLHNENDGKFADKSWLPERAPKNAHGPTK